MNKDRFKGYDPDVRQLVLRFEQQRDGHNVFFDVDQLEIIIDYYLEVYDIEGLQSAVQYAESLFPLSDSIRMRRANLYSVQGRYKEAFAILTELEHNNPDDTDVCYSLGTLHSVMGNPSKAIEYYLKHETIDRDFHLTDAEYEDFVAYAAAQDFDARTAAQTALDQMIRAAKAEDLYDNYKEEIEALQKKVNMDKAAVLRAKKAEILPLVEQEIVTCYYFNRASVPVALRYDEQLREAVDKWVSQ